MTEPIQTPEFWDGNADQYVASAEPFTAQFCEDAVVLAEIEADVALLDIATGPGALALAAARAGARVTAIDFSAEMIDRLRSRVGDLPIKALRMDGQALDFPDASFDRVCSVFGIPLFPDWRAGLRELARVLRPGGRAVVAVADNGHGFGPNQLLAAARAVITGTPAPAQIAAWEILADRERFADEMHRAGLDEVVIHERTHDFALDPTVFVADHPMILHNPVLAGLEQADRDDVIADAHRHADRGKLLLPGTARIAVATKP
jgi:SAM-dependent methyltransferase